MPNGGIEPTTDYVKILASATGSSWPTISRARSSANEILEKLGSTLSTFISDDVYTDSRFLECREVSHSIQVALMNVCVDRQTELRDFVREYGVF